MIQKSGNQQKCTYYTFPMTTSIAKFPLGLENTWRRNVIKETVRTGNYSWLVIGRLSWPSSRNRGKVCLACDKICIQERASRRRSTFHRENGESFDRSRRHFSRRDACTHRHYRHHHRHSCRRPRRNDNAN